MTTYQPTQTPTPTQLETTQTPSPQLSPTNIQKTPTKLKTNPKINAKRNDNVRSNWLFSFGYPSLKVSQKSKNGFIKKPLEFNFLFPAIQFGQFKYFGQQSNQIFKEILNQILPKNFAG